MDETQNTTEQQKVNVDPMVMLSLDYIRDAWNSQADGYNQWDNLSGDECVEFVLSIIASQPVNWLATIDELRRQVAIQNDALRKKNILLDALHYVWCSGGCRKGIHRYTDGDQELTEEMVVAAERNTKRMRMWFEADKRRKEA